MKIRNYRKLLPVLAIAAVFSLPRCDCGGDQPTIDKAYCTDLGLEYREKDGKGYCYKLDTIVPDAVDCASAADGSACDDGNACTYGDHCDQASASCVGTELTGIDDGNPCTQDSCDPETGELHFDPLPMEGQSCDDGDVCSNNDSCQQGRCVGDYTVDRNGDPIDDGDACTRDFCDSTGSRLNLPYSASEAAELGLGISLSDLANPCLSYQCAVGTNDSPHMANLDGQDCSDAAAGRRSGNCLSWTCRSGSCAPEVDANAIQTASPSAGQDLAADCRQRECDSDTGNVVFVVDPNHVDAPCDDDNSCTFDDRCDISGHCVARELAHGTACTDGNACTTGDYCHINNCVPGRDYLALANEQADPENPDSLDSYRDPAGILANADPCQQYSCDPVKGVVVQAVADGTDCDDENACTAHSSCQGGLCVGERDDHNDGLPCPNSANSCEEGHCDKGICVNPQPVQDQRACEGSDPCKTYQCEDQAGHGQCTISGDVPNNPTVQCGIESECSVSFCVDGNCISNLSARDGNSCTGEGQNFDPRCNAPQCSSSVCLPNPLSEGTSCSLTADDIASSDLACNTGACHIIGNIGYCQPVAIADNSSCDNHNPCDGADWCQATMGVGHCVERYTSDDPTALNPSNANCGVQPENCYDNMAPIASTAAACEVDGDPKTVGRCNYRGDCVEISQVVDDNNGCTRSFFNEVTGQLEQENKANGSACHTLNINPCELNLGVCIDGACETNPMPDGTSCDLSGQEIPNLDDLPAGQRPECFAEVCRAGQCVIDTAIQNGKNCDDGETVCSEAGQCQNGSCQQNDTARGYGETCSAPATALVDLQGHSIEAKDQQCWAAFECDASGSCAVAVAPKANGVSCDFTLDGDACDGWCQEGICASHLWNQVDELSCDDGEVCTRDQCDGSGACQNIAYADGSRQGCQGVDDNNACNSMQCAGGHCESLNNDFNICSDDNPCTLSDHCNAGVCESNTLAPAGTACGDPDSDTDCERQVCNDNGQCTDNVQEPDDSPCNIDDSCASYSCQSGQCVSRGAAFQRPDGTQCDSNGIPCDEACLDLDGPQGPQPSACRDFATFGALLTAKRMASGDHPDTATDSEELACRALYDPSFDPNSANPESSGNSCARWACYYGACRNWDDETLPAELFAHSNSNYGSNHDPSLDQNPRDGSFCQASDNCSERGVCANSVCQSYNFKADGTACGNYGQCQNGDDVYASSCQAGACTDRNVLVGRCSDGIATCQASHCQGADDCSHSCNKTNYDLVNTFEDISGSGMAQRSRLRSPLDPIQLCGNISTAGPLSEQRRRACDDGSVLLDLQDDLGFNTSSSEGYWFYQRRYRYISISANGTVLLNKDHPDNLSESEDTLFVGGDLGGQGLANLQNGENAAQIRVFRDDLTLVSDIDVPDSDKPQDDTVPYGSFRGTGEIYVRHMPGPDAFIGDDNDYLIIQWNNVAFYGCAAQSPARSHMTFQLKWWPGTGQMVFVYPPNRNSDGPDSDGCLPDRIHGADASIGLFNEGGSSSRLIAENSWSISNDSGPDSDSFDAYFLLWPKDRPSENYGLMSNSAFVELSAYDDQTGDRSGQKLEEVSSCNDCCERVDFDAPIFIRGERKDAMMVCSDGLVKMIGQQVPRDVGRSPENTGINLVTELNIADMLAPFWGNLQPAANTVGGIYWQDRQGPQGREIVVEWSRIDNSARLAPAGLPITAQEYGEALCDNNADNDHDGLVDCDDDSCSCAQVCGGIGCGLSFELVYHDGLNFVEFRYLNKEGRYLHAKASSPATLGVSQSIDLWDGIDGGDVVPGGNLLLGPSFDEADDDEFRPGEQRNAIIPLGGVLLPKDH